MVKDGVNRFGRTGPLVTRAVIPSGIVKIIAVNDLFIGLNYKVSTFQNDSTHGKFNSTVKTENGKFAINGKASTTFFQE